MKERRRAPRYPVRDVHGTLILSASATILNMSLTGMAVESRANLRVGRRYRLQLSRGDGGPITLAGTVVWCHLRETRGGDDGERAPVYEAGIAFQDVLSEKATELLAFLRESAIITLQERLTGRFRLQIEQPIDLDSEYEFEVKTISASGMLIETDISPEPDSLFQMKVQLDGGTMSACGRVAFLRNVAEQDKRRITAIGIEFIDMSDADRAALEGFIARQIALPL